MAALENGYILIHRKVFKNPLFRDAERFRAWCLILANVNYEDQEVVVRGKKMICHRGESLRSLNSWAELFGIGWNKCKVQRFFQALKADTVCDTVCDTVFERQTIRLTVLNYDTYQKPRYDNDTVSDTVSDTVTDTKGIQLNKTKKRVCPSGGANGYSEDFLIFWGKYPLKKGKKRAAVAWRNAHRPDLAVILKALEKQKRTPQWEKDDGQFIPHPTTWIHGERWEDEVAAPQPKTGMEWLDAQIPETTEEEELAERLELQIRLGITTKEKGLVTDDPNKSD